jgi:phosphoglycolate phosphatase-like HAD superfamily hydrolase
MTQFKPGQPFLVAMDSDGCAFDTMELKHKECFIPNLINYFNLQPVSKYARQVAEYVNLYSRSRGIHRFPALVETFELLKQRAEVQARKVVIEIPHSLRAWIREEPRLSNHTLEQRARETDDEALERCLAWSLAVNRAIDELVRHVPPFPLVRESLKKLQSTADVIVCSATPTSALRKEWHEHGLDKYVREIFGQEAGGKKEILSIARQYAPQRALMIGDAPGDLAAAQGAGCLFFPINPGAEEASWQQLYSEGLDRFLQGTFTDSYQADLVHRFWSHLPDHPPWANSAPT